MRFINFDNIVKIIKIILIKMFLFLNMFQTQLLLGKVDAQRLTWFLIY